MLLGTCGLNDEIRGFRFTLLNFSGWGEGVGWRGWSAGNARCMTARKKDTWKCWSLPRALVVDRQNTVDLLVRMRTSPIQLR